MQRFIALLFSLAMTLGSYAARAAGDTKASELLAQARAALGGESKLSKVQGLSCTGTVQRAIGDRQVTGDVTIDLQLPDKLLRSDSISPMGDAALVVTEQGINGEQLLRHSKTLNTPPAQSSACRHRRRAAARPKRRGCATRGRSSRGWH